MEAEQVVEKILAEANAEADKIKSEASEKCARAEADLQSQLAGYGKETEALANAAAEDKTARMLASARMANRKEQLTAKVALLDDVFVKARQQILALDDGKYLELIGKLMAQAVETGDEEVIVGKEEKRIDDGFLERMNRTLGPPLKGNLRFAAERYDIDGGIILRRGNNQVNVSMDILLAQAREQLEAELAGELFEKEQRKK